MSNLHLSGPYNNMEGSEFLRFLDDSWPLYQGILQSEIINSNRNGDHPVLNSADVHVGQQHSATPQVAGGHVNGLKFMKVDTSSNSKTRQRNRKISDENAAMEQRAEQGTSSVAKKLNHNAKERIRRMKINASYLALRALLPHSRRSKKRWTAPAIVDRALQYIPELENEIKALRSNKENVKSHAKAKNIANQNPTFSFSKINQQEAIIQIFIAREDQNGSPFTNLLQNLEDEGIRIKNASTLNICGGRTCYNLHIQINHTAIRDYNIIEELSDKVISWLR